MHIKNASAVNDTRDDRLCSSHAKSCDIHAHLAGAHATPRTSKKACSLNTAVEYIDASAAAEMAAANSCHSWRSACSRVRASCSQQRQPEGALSG